MSFGPPPAHHIQLRCHRFILADASPVWDAALNGDFRESHAQQLEISDAEPEAVEALLCYAYTRRAPDKVCVSLLGLAHRYQMKELAAYCADRLMEQRSNICARGVESVGRAARVDRRNARGRSGCEVLHDRWEMHGCDSGQAK